MAEAREFAPPPTPAPTPAGSNASNKAARYQARWDTPMPISSAEERRSPMPAAAAPPPNRFDPNAVATAEAQLQKAMAQATQGPLAGLSAETYPPVGSNDRTRAYGMLAGMVNPVAEEEPDNRTAVAKAEDQLGEALRAQREQGIGANKPNRVPLRERGDRMTTEEYNALTPVQRAAVDFNGMLYTAAIRDKKMRDEVIPTPGEKEEYDKLVTSMFGEDGGSKRYAPETVAVLAKIGYEDDSADLDDFLGLKAAIREKDLKYLEDSKDSAAEPVTQFFGDPSVPVKQPEGLNDPRLDRVGMARDIATKTRAMQEALVHGNQLLQSINLTARVDRAYLTDKIGGEPLTPAPAELGYAPASFDANGNPMDLNSYYQMAFDKVAQGDKAALGVLKGDLDNGIISQREYDTFFAYADSRTRNAENYGANLGNAEGVTYLSPEDARKMLGLSPKGAGR